MRNWETDTIHRKGKQMRSVWEIEMPESVWAITTPKKEEKIFGKHPTQKPLELLKRVVLASTKKGDIVLDPFTGSSTTGLAAVFYGRKFIGVDMEKKYLDLSVKRFKELNNQKKLF
jgi:site-specific DNA-methyltransferase (adenine-specific)